MRSATPCGCGSCPISTARWFQRTRRISLCWRRPSQPSRNGLFYDNSAEGAFDLGCEHDNYFGRYRTYEAEDGNLDFYLILGPRLMDVTAKFVALTGRTALPPRWSLGFAQTAMALADAPDIGADLEIPNQDSCEQAFPGAPSVNFAVYNQDYDQPFLSSSSSAPSNILFTYGSDDVWTNIGLSEQKNSNPDIAIAMITGAGHHFDLNAPSSSDTPAVIAARNQFLTLAKQWLKRP